MLAAADFDWRKGNQTTSASELGPLVCQSKIWAASGNHSKCLQGKTAYLSRVCDRTMPSLSSLIEYVRINSKCNTSLQAFKSQSQNR